MQVLLSYRSTPVSHGRERQSQLCSEGGATDLSPRLLLLLSLRRVCLAGRSSHFKLPDRDRGFERDCEMPVSSR